MITQEQFQALLSFEPGEHKVLSLYLNTDTSQESSEAIKLKARNLLREADTLEADAQAIETYLNHSFDWKTPGLACLAAVGVTFLNRLQRPFPSATASVSPPNRT